MYDGSVHALKVSGLSFGDVGISSVELSGEVYQLTDPKDLAGPYVAAAAGAAMGKGVSNIVLRNPKGVVMRLESKQEGVRLTSFYSAAPVCSPSRASFLTGCYPRRVGLHVDFNGTQVLMAASARGLNPDEDTLAENLRRRQPVLVQR